MTARPLIFALILAAAPLGALAQGCGDHGDQRAMSCAEGSQWDPQTSTCTPIVSG